MTNNELLLAISQMMDVRFDALDRKIDMVQESLSRDIHKINLTMENMVFPRIAEIENCYLTTFERYKLNNENIEEMQLDIRVIKDVVSEHAERLSMYQGKLAMA